MQSYTAKPAKPVTVQAVQYEAPNGTDVAGNLDEIAAAGFVFEQQTPWEPAGGQHSIRVQVSGGEKLAAAGDYLVQYDGGWVAVLTEAQLHADYDLVAETKAN